MTPEREQRILLEVVLKRPPAVPDTPADAALRAKLRVQVDEIHARGGTVDFPADIDAERPDGV